ncbi:MAG: DNA polymerase III subunit delta [Butyrivibrio sp.]|nr:DNA polymerase III subunit delta [Butyrivibrio sp.]
MADFADIIDQNQIIEHMQNALATGKISHAYIIEGEEDAGKEFITRVFAKAIQCEHREKKGEFIEACNECHSCIQATSLSNPDIITVTHEKPATISVDNIREQVRDDVIIKPYASKYKIYIIPEGEKMNASAQNALLKTLEEPPAYVIIFILTSNLNAFLQTILSRCVVLSLKPARDESIKNYLMNNLHVVDYKAELCSSFARGNVGKAIKLAENENFENLKNSTIELISKLSGLEIYEVNNRIQEILTPPKTDDDSKSKTAKKGKKSEENEGKKKSQKADLEIVEDFFDVLLYFFRDVLVYKAEENTTHLIFNDKLSYIRDITDHCTYSGINHIIESLGTAQNRIKANVNVELTLQMLFIDIKENI